MLNKEPFRIAISGRSGCGNSTVSTILSERLELKLVNYTFHNIAEDRAIDFNELCEMAEVDPQWDYFVDENQVKLAMEGSSVLGSRLAIWMLKNADLKVFLTASPETRAGRIYKREGGVFEQRMVETAARDDRDHARYKKLYDINNDDYAFADLVINTDRLNQHQVAGIIEAAARAMAGVSEA
ncbi:MULTISPECIES: (d)CMP kinase [unclassified Oceanispirochaeta]|uniref:(d)CMP kinase n=1 Tax=unclassified Oceanispirochaeta TaxID=2635722 RepID=UPI000E08EEFE|nr:MULTISPECIES: cytidylate kinase family protein [unclassified Oceanispirochaeta]MBF9018167.1 cytidylate kinase family protein [Oceanispirochaeta sp. M2]NPD74650.1 AAA family ATPase [Oceanispirochaeta sp. M1]RDG29520.1 cytidylate kinase [Oceanispirochaeta sp. M1]